MNIAMGPIPSPRPKPSLLYTESSAGTPPLIFYINDLFSGFHNFESQLSFLEHYFFPRIE